MKYSSPVRRLRFKVSLLIALLFFSTAAVHAHTQSTAYLNLRATPTGLTGEWQLALRDLEDAVGLDVNDDGVITWSELSAQKCGFSLRRLAAAHTCRRADGRIARQSISRG